MENRKIKMSNFTFVGYELKKKFSIPVEDFKVPSTCVTMDTSLSKRHPQASELKWEEINGILNATYLRIYLEDLEKVYSGLSEEDKNNYCIFGYSVETENMNFIVQDMKDGDIVQSVPKFAYAEKGKINISKSFKLLGYEVIDASIEWLSAQTNCSYRLNEIERFGLLNEYNLFTEYQNAKLFRDFADIDASEHSPFSVWQIWGPSNRF